MSKKAKPPAVQYPTWKWQSSPTPNNTLVVCTKCGKAQWAMDSNGSFQQYCQNGHPPARMRKATKAELKAANEALAQDTPKRRKGR